MDDLSTSSSPAGSIAKEKEFLKERSLSESGKESFMVEEKEPDKVEDEEVASYLEKIEKEIYLAKPVTDDSGQPLVTAPSAQAPNIVLPLTQTKLFYGLKQKTTESIRWLAEWCLRIIKMLGSRATLRKEDGDSA